MSDKEFALRIFMGIGAMFTFAAVILLAHLGCLSHWTRLLQEVCRGY